MVGCNHNFHTLISLKYIITISAKSFKRLPDLPVKFIDVFLQMYKYFIVLRFCATVWIGYVLFHHPLFRYKFDICCWELFQDCILMTVSHNEQRTVFNIVFCHSCSGCDGTGNPASSMRDSDWLLVLLFTTESPRDEMSTCGCFMRA